MHPVIHRVPAATDTPQPDPCARDELWDPIRIAAERARRGRSSQSLLLVGPRGASKGARLDRVRDDLAASGILTLRVEASTSRSLPALLVWALRETLLPLSRKGKARELGCHALRAIAGFARALHAQYPDMEVGPDVDPEPGLADTGVLESDLQDVLEATGHAVRQADTALVMFIDALQRVEAKQLAALIGALHRTGQRQLPVMLVGSGLPQLRARVGDAKPYAERMFAFYDARASVTRCAATEDIHVDTTRE